MRFLVTAFFGLAASQWGWLGATDAPTDAPTKTPKASTKTPASTSAVHKETSPTSEGVLPTQPSEKPELETQAPHPVSHTPPPASVHNDVELPETDDEKIAANFPIGECCGTQQTFRECKVRDCEQTCVDCRWDGWSPWSACMCHGLKERSRVILQPNNDCGKVCEGNLVETATCVPACQQAALDCSLSEWSVWDTCDKDCNGGQTLASRHVRTVATKGGKPCDGELKKTKVCGEGTCTVHVDCLLGPWQPWQECSRSCGNGQQQRFRTIERQPSLGHPCTAPLKEIQGCSEKACGGEIDCVWGDWEKWGACSRSCGGGQRNRNRVVKVSPREGGKLCSALVSSETETCNTEFCTQAADCMMGAWGEWDACSCTANGIRRRNRHIDIYPQEGGKGCTGSLKEVEGCNEDFSLPSDHVHVQHKRDCVLGEWDSWDQCSKSCGVGSATRRRSIVVEQAHGGKPCEGSLYEVMGCNEGKCEHLTEKTIAPTSEHHVVDCEWSDWDSWSACSASCGGGQRNRLRQIVRMCNAYGKPCGHHASMEMEACGNESCDCQDCSWAEWGEWSACTCTGLQEAHRAIREHRSACGKPCVGDKVKTQSCQPHCEEDELHSCQWGMWSSWGSCTAECGGGQMQRYRSIISQARNGGHPCAGTSKEASACNTAACGAPADCAFDDWTRWSTCPVTCGGADQFRHRSIQTTSVSGGKGCSGYTKEVRGCGEASCVKGDSQDCKWNQWSTYSACSASCGGGMKQRDRSIVQAPRNFGKLCSAEVKSEVAACNTQSCGDTCVDASWGRWAEWSRCSATCGKAYRSRSRTIAVQANECGKSTTGDFQEYAECPTMSCSLNMRVIDCALSEWTEWTGCSCSCDGVKDRSRRVNRYAENGGAPCSGSLRSVAPCNSGTCSGVKDVDCELGHWSGWEPCSHSCGGGVQKQSRRVITPQAGFGNPCNHVLQRVQGCHYISCSVGVDCEWGEWTTWSDCTKKCGGGQRNRYRHIAVLPQNDGKACDIGANSETDGCNHSECGHRAFCGWALWDAWGSCSASCGWGTQKRARHLDIKMESDENTAYLSSGILNEMFHVSDPAMEKLFGAFIAGLCVCGVLLSFVHRTFRNSVSYTRLMSPTE